MSLLELQIREGTEDNSKIVFLISQCMRYLLSFLSVPKSLLSVTKCQNIISSKYENTLKSWGKTVLILECVSIHLNFTIFSKGSVITTYTGEFRDDPANPVTPEKVTEMFRSAVENNTITAFTVDRDSIGHTGMQL